jgi:hypothetical protein
MANAIRMGNAESTDANGYLISARKINNFNRCSNFEVVVSYDGLLSDVSTTEASARNNQRNCE